MRIQLELPEEDVQELQALMKDARIDTYKDLFSNALTLLHWAGQEVKAGNSIASLNDNDNRVKILSVPMLDRLARAAQRQAAAAAEPTLACIKK